MIQIACMPLASDQIISLQNLLKEQHTCCTNPKIDRVWRSVKKMPPLAVHSGHQMSPCTMYQYCLRHSNPSVNQLLLRETPPNLGAIEKVSKSVHDPGTKCYFVAKVQIQRDDGATSERSKVPPNLENLGVISQNISFFFLDWFPIHYLFTDYLSLWHIIEKLCQLNHWKLSLSSFQCVTSTSKHGFLSF